MCIGCKDRQQHSDATRESAYHMVFQKLFHFRISVDTPRKFCKTSTNASRELSTLPCWFCCHKILLLEALLSKSTSIDPNSTSSWPHSHPKPMLSIVLPPNLLQKIHHGWIGNRIPTRVLATGRLSFRQPQPTLDMTQSQTKPRIRHHQKQLPITSISVFQRSVRKRSNYFLRVFQMKNAFSEGQSHTSSFKFPKLIADEIPTLLDYWYSRT